MEPWFKRYLILNRFIRAVRNTILKNRMLKNLDKLRQLEEDTVEEHARNHKKYENVTYAEIFDRFIAP